VPEETEDLKQTLDRAFAIVQRRRWWILPTFSFVTLAAIAVSYLLPAQYKSEATILVEQQQVPERYVTPTTTTDLIQILQPMSQEVLKRERLLRMIDELGLYPSEKKQLGPDELVQLMRKNIEIEPLVANSENRKANLFKITYVGNNPHVAQDVVSRLTSSFVEENLKNLELQANGTTTFLGDQLNSARTSLEEQEKQIRDFKMQHLGEMPSDQPSNLQILSGLQSQMQNTEATLGRARQQQVYLESLLAQYRSLVPKSSGEPNATSANRIAMVEKQLTDLRTKRAALVAQYTPEHPDVVSIDRQISQTQALLDLLRKNQKTAAASDANTEEAVVQMSDGDDPAVVQLKSQLRANQMEIDNAVAEQKQLQVRIAEYQRRLNQTPIREVQLAELQRDYNLSQQNYAGLESKRTESALAARLVQNQQGEQFRIVDGASLPTRPSSPDRRKLSLMGAGLGLFLGACIALALEIKNTSFRSEKEVSQLMALPFVLGVPLLLTASEERRHARTRILEWVSGSSLVTAVLIAETLVLLRG